MTARNFKNKVALVTGGGSGLGKEIASQLAACEAKVVIASRNLERLEATAKEIEAAGGTVLPVRTDIREVEQVESLVQQTMERFGRIDVLVNNAAGNFVVPSEKLSYNGWNSVVNIVLNGTWYCTSAAGKHMIAQKSGAILNIIATYAWSGAPGVVHSASAKAGVLAMTRTLAAEWGRYGIRVNALAPGIMVTEGASKNLRFDTAEAQELLRKHVPLGRLGTVAEVANIACWLCSDEAAYVSGDAMSADGGAWIVPKNFLELMT